MASLKGREALLLRQYDPQARLRPPLGGRHKVVVVNQLGRGVSEVAARGWVNSMRGVDWIAHFGYVNCSAFAGNPL